MPEAVIVSAARSPIGRANKGSLKDFRPDDLAALIVRTALDKVPGLDPNTVDDLYLGCGLPGGESGQQHGPGRQRAQRDGRRARRHAHPLLRLVGADHAGWRSTRSRPARATSSSPPASRRCRATPRAPPTTGRTPTTRCSTTPKARTAKTAEGGIDWHDPREDGELPDVYIAMGQTAENVARLRGLKPRGARRVRRPLAEPRREGDRRRLLGPRDHAGHHARRHRGRQGRRPARRASPSRRSRSSTRSSAPTASSPPATAARSTTAPPRS